MKIRIQDNSIRFRLTLREVEDFGRSGRLERRTEVPTAREAACFVYAIEHVPGRRDSAVELGSSSITLLLGDEDRATLLTPTEEGAYIRREWTGPDGDARRFLAFVEKDRPGSTCVKPEAWIYDAPPHGPLETRPIPAKVR